MTVRRTGLDNAPLIPVGSTVTAATWHLAEHYGPGIARETERDAILAGIAMIEERIAKGTYHDGHSQFSIDLRWKMAHPEGGSTEFTVRRQTYDTVEEAREHVENIDRYAGVGR